MVSKELQISNGSRERTNQTEKSQYASENFYYQDFHKQVWICSIGEGSRRACDTDADTAQKVACTNGKATPEEGKASEIVCWSVQLCGGEWGKFGRVDNPNNL